jgi:hypothetical protein
MLGTPKTLPKNTLLTNLPGTKPVKVEYLSTTNVFALPNATATVIDADRSLRLALMAMPEIYGNLEILVSDELHGHRFVGATLLVLEIDAPDHVTMLWHCNPLNHTAVQVLAE